MTKQTTIETMRWMGDEAGCLSLIDQTRLPVELVEIECTNIETVWRAIKALQVRGAPAIGIAAAYGVVLGMQASKDSVASELATRLIQACDYLATSRPTAVNLFWALDRMRRVGQGLVTDYSADTSQVIHGLLKEARAIHEEDR